MILARLRGRPQVFAPRISDVVWFLEGKPTVTAGSDQERFEYFRDEMKSYLMERRKA